MILPMNQSLSIAQIYRLAIVCGVLLDLIIEVFDCRTDTLRLLAMLHIAGISAPVGELRVTTKQLRGSQFLIFNFINFNDFSQLFFSV